VAGRPAADPKSPDGWSARRLLELDPRARRPRRVRPEGHRPPPFGPERGRLGPVADWV